MLTVWYFDITNYKEKDFNEGINYLLQKNKEEVLKYKYSKDRHLRLVARLLLRKAIIETGFSPNLFNLWKKNHLKKPIIEEWMNFNISHSGDYVVVAFSSDFIVGIDIEKPKKGIDVGMLSSFFLDEERVAIMNSENIEESFYNIWTRKEAVLKGIGKGIVHGLKEFSCLKDKVEIESEIWYLKKINIFQDYICTLASNSNIENVIVKKITNNVLI